MTHPKQFIGMNRSALIGLTNVSANGGTTNITTALTTALSSAGNDQVSGATSSVPLQVAASGGVGVITSSPGNRVKVLSNTTKNDVLGTGNQEVFARITESAGVYTLTYYTLQAGVETAHSFGSATAIDVLLPYRFSPATYPLDAMLLAPVRNVSDDATGGAAPVKRIENVTPTALNTLPNLNFTPIAGSVELTVNGITYDSLGGGSARFSVSGQTITWNSANGTPAFSVTTTDRIIAIYES